MGHSSVHIKMHIETELGWTTRKSSEKHIAPHYWVPMQTEASSQFEAFWTSLQHSRTPETRMMDCPRIHWRSPARGMRTCGSCGCLCSLLGRAWPRGKQSYKKREKVSPCDISEFLNLAGLSYICHWTFQLNANNFPSCTTQYNLKSYHLGYRKNLNPKDRQGEARKQ